MIRRSVLALLVLSTACASVGRTGSSNGGGNGGAEAETMPLYGESVTGPHNRVITTSSQIAQQYFDQGMQLLYAFNPAFAAESFREAQKADPDCAMCYFGEAWALGPYLNGPMRADNAPEAYDAVRRAKELAKDHSNEIERALIDAMAVRYERNHDPDRRRMLDSLYSVALGDAFQEYPDDPEIGTLYGESQMLMLPRRGRWDETDPKVQKVHRTLEHVLRRDIRHPGACHLYIHATEPTESPQKAERCADFLGQAIPGASHIQHMPSHTYNRIGRWADAVKANTQAWHSDQKAEYGEGIAIYPSHNVHMLLFAASMDGQGAVAAQAAREYDKVVDGGQFYRALVLVRFGRWDEVLELTQPPTPPTFKGLWIFSRGYAHLKMGQADSAATYLDMLRLEIDNMPEGANFRGHPGENLLGVVAGMLEGEMLAMDGRRARAIEVLETAVELEDGLRYDEPEPLNFSARHWLGAILLEDGKGAEAERVYRAALDDHPNNGWSLFGLEQSLRAQGKSAAADQVHRDFLRAWDRADVWLRSSRF